MRLVEFAAQLLQELLKPDDKHKLDLAYRTLRTSPKDCEPPHPLVIRVNLFAVHNRILQRAREASPLLCVGKKSSIFPDLTQKCPRNEPSLLV